MRVLIVDDERPARDKLQRLLQQYRNVSTVIEARDGIDALDKIAQCQPDVVFLDIQMPEVTGLEVAASLPRPAPLLVFVTAYDAYALQAFDANATDYLLKPFDDARFARAMQRVGERFAQRNLASMEERFPNVADRVHQLLVTDRGITTVVKLADVLWIETADNYVMLHTAARDHLLRQTLSGLLQRIGPQFVRCHRRAAVDIARVEQLVALDKGDGELVLQGGARVPCSRQYRQGVITRLQERGIAG